MPQHEINQLDLITQRALALHVKSLEEQLYRTLTALEAAQKRIAELETPPKALPDDESKIDA